MSGERKTWQTSVSERLEYKISYNDDRTLQWHPPVRSTELEIASRQSVETGNQHAVAE